MVRKTAGSHHQKVFHSEAARKREAFKEKTGKLLQTIDALAKKVFFDVKEKFSFLFLRLFRKSSRRNIHEIKANTRPEHSKRETPVESEDALAEKTTEDPKDLLPHEEMDPKNALLASMALLRQTKGNRGTTILAPRASFDHLSPVRPPVDDNIRQKFSSVLEALKGPVKLKEMINQDPPKEKPPLEGIALAMSREIDKCTIIPSDA